LYKIAPAKKRLSGFVDES
jgi:hypothetical protein